MNDAIRVPRHVAIVMDGNGRWAKARFQPRSFGHHAGRKAVRAVVEARYRLVVAGTEPLEGSSRAELTWVKQADGWQVGRALVSGVAGQPLPGGWK